LLLQRMIQHTPFSTLKTHGDVVHCSGYGCTVTHPEATPFV
jgi:hypothetical protein